MGKRQISCTEEFQIICYRYYALKEGEHSSPPLDVCQAVTFQRVKQGEGKEDYIYRGENLRNTTSARSRSASPCWQDAPLIGCGEKENFTSDVFLPQTHNPVSSWEKHQTDPSWGMTYKIPGCAPQPCQVWDGHSQEEPKEMWQLNVPGCPWGDPGTERLGGKLRKSE